MKDHICQLRIEFVLVEIFVDLFQVRKQRVLLQFEINVAISKPGFG
jgi:hypothetical protein